MRTEPHKRDYLLPPLGCVLHVIIEHPIKAEISQEPVTMRRALRRLNLADAARIRAQAAHQHLGTPESYATFDTGDATVLWLTPTPAAAFILHIRAFPPAISL